MKEKSVLFVCTFNLFRSVAAEYCFKAHLLKNGNTEWNVGSAGTLATPSRMDPAMIELLQEFDADPTGHIQRRLTRDMLSEYSVVIGMAEDHITFMKSEFGFENALFFNEFAIEEASSIWDVADDVPDYLTNRSGMETKITNTVRYIHNKTPTVFKNIQERFYSIQN